MLLPFTTLISLLPPLCAVEATFPAGGDQARAQASLSLNSQSLEEGCSKVTDIRIARVKNPPRGTLRLTPP